MKKKILLSALSCAIVFTTNSFAFSDVPKDFWGYEAINFMQEKGIVNGFAEDGTFRPSNLATREQTATILRKFFEIPLKNKVKEFSDVNSDSWSKPHIDLASQYLYDENETTFRPYDFTTRIEVAEAVLRILGLDLDEPNLEKIKDFKDYSLFTEEEKQIIALTVENGIMKGYDDGTFLPNGKITRAEICSLLYNAFNGKSELLEKNNDKVLMSVNGVDITVKEFNVYFGVQKKIYEMLFGTNKIWEQEIQDTILYAFAKDLTKDELIKIKLILENAEKMNIKIDKETRKEFETQLDTENSELLCDYYGISKDDMLKIMEESKINELIAKKVYDTISHKDHEHKDINALEDLFTYDVRHILISTQNKTEEEIVKAKELAESLFKRINNGEDFSKLAYSYSEDEGSSTNGGLYEKIRLGQFVSEVENAAVNGRVGEVWPEIVESDFGYHIIKTEGMRTDKVGMDENAKMEIINADFEQVLLKWFEEADIKFNQDIYDRI